MRTHPSLLGSENQDMTTHDRVGEIWKKTATMPWSEYMNTVKGVSQSVKNLQGDESAENQESMKRSSEFVRNHRFDTNIFSRGR
jgi:hypothetical protein